MAKIVQAYPKPGKTCHTEAVWQWDSGCIVHLNEIDLPPSYKAEFSNVAVRGIAKPSILTGDSFEIPAEYQESGSPVYIWIVYVDESGRETILSIITPVNARSKPVDEPFIPQERSEAEQLMAALNSSVDRAEEAASSAASSAETSLEKSIEASGYAEAALSARNDAVAAKDLVEEKASDVNESAALAALSAHRAVDSAMQAFDSASMALDAKSSAESAALSAQSDAQSVSRAVDSLESTIAADLQAAKDSGLFDGADGYSPTAVVRKTGNTSTISITDKNGTTETVVKDGQNGTMDVRINEESIVTNDIANIPVATFNNVGLVKAQTDYGIGLNPKGDGGLRVEYADDSIIKKGTGTGSLYKPIVPYTQHYATFYGLAKAAGADMASSPNSIGTYSEEAKTAIRSMLGVQNFEQQSIAILANGNTHAAIASGQYVYVRGHLTISEGLYVARSAIATNGALSASNLAAVPEGGLNSVIARVENRQTAVVTWDSSHTPVRSDIAVAYKKGQTCQLIFWNVSWSSEITSDTPVGTIPTGFRPPEKTFFYGYNRLDQLCKGWLGPDGVIRISKFPGELMYVSITYITAY